MLRQISCLIAQAVWFLGLLMTTGMAQLPYRCGFVLDSKSAIIEVYGPELAVLDLHPGNVVADIGGSNGYRMGMFAVLYDSLQIYIQDIDTACLNSRELQGVISHYSKIKGSPLDATFEIVVGDEGHTHLPTHTFDKVLVTVAYHHFNDPAAMLADIAETLKPTGRIYLIENVVRRDGKRRRRLCDDPLVSESTLSRAFESYGMQVISVHSLGRWWTKMFVLQPKP
jgi:SAM-dependent methyltransferase